MNFVDVAQPYETRVGDEFVILGNDALVKCSVPSFAADYLEVVGWVTDQGYAIDSTSVDGNQNSQRQATLSYIIYECLQKNTFLERKNILLYFEIRTM